MTSEEQIEGMERMAWLEKQARQLGQQARAGILSTLAATTGHPYGSVVEPLMDERGKIWLLLSDLAVHSANLAADGRASVVIRQSDTQPAEGGADIDESTSLLASSRATFVGQAQQVLECPEAVRRQYLERYEGASQYVAFKDFNFYCLTIERVRVVAGFGRIGWVDWEDLSTTEANGV